MNTNESKPDKSKHLSSYKTHPKLCIYQQGLNEHQEQQLDFQQRKKHIEMNIIHIVQRHVLKTNI